MAKLRRPSQRSIDLYNQLVARQNEVRKTLSRMHKKAEETLKVGRLPALVIPKRARKIRPDYFYGLSKQELRRRLRKFWAKYRKAKEWFNQGLRSYLGRSVLYGYSKLWQDQLGVEPEGRGGRYTKEQIMYSDLGDYMEVYNMLFTHGPELFMALLATGRVIEFRYIYDDMTGKVERHSMLNQQVDIIKGAIRPSKEQTQILETAQIVTGLDLFVKRDKRYSGKHNKSTYEKARKLQEEDEDE